MNVPSNLDFTVFTRLPSGRPKTNGIGVREYVINSFKDIPSWIFAITNILANIALSAVSVMVLSCNLMDFFLNR